jgi:RimJ/RimL family protein N-acetyltransferase
VKLEGFPQNLTLKDGTQVVVRPLDAQDAPALLEFYRALPEEDRLYLRDDVTKPEWVDRFVAHVKHHEVVSLIALHGKKVVGEASLYRALHGWTAHVGEIRVSVSPNLRRSGLGTTLARDLVKLAIGLGVEKMIAQMVESQISAQRMFEKLGFRQEAVLRGHVRDIHGIKRDLLIASNDVSHLWEAMEAMVSDFSPTMG